MEVWNDVTIPDVLRKFEGRHTAEPEEALVKLYRLLKDEPELKSRPGMDVDERRYFDLVTFWIENRGRHCGYPHWLGWGNPRSEQWIRESGYSDASFGSHSRPS